MNPNFLDLAKSQLTGDVIQKFGGYVGESTQSTQRAFGSAVPAVLAGFVDHASRASSDPVSSGLMRTLAEGADDGSMLEQLPALAGGGSATEAIVRRGERTLASLFGDRLPATVDQVAASSGVSKGSASKILGLAAPLMTAIIGREAKSRGLGGEGITSMLLGQKTAGAITEEPTALRRSVLPAKGIPMGRRLGLPLVLLGVLGLVALLFLFRGRAPTAPTMPEHHRMGKVEAPKAPQVFGGGPVDPGDQLKRFFADPNAHVPKRIVLDGVFFSPSSAALNPTSQTSVDSVATALKQDPTAKVRIEGFTEATSDPANDQRLSVQRAYAVRDELVRNGIDPSRIAVAGYGAERPMSPADTPEGRAKNSRIELIVTDR